MITIALDAMGGDHAPRAEVEGAILAARELGVRVLLVGIEATVRQELSAPQTPRAAHRDGERHRRHHHDRFALARFSPQERKLAACGRAAGARRQGGRAGERGQYGRGDDGSALRAWHVAFGGPPALAAAFPT